MSAQRQFLASALKDRKGEVREVSPPNVMMLLVLETVVVNNQHWGIAGRQERLEQLSSKRFSSVG
jgi:hypothetical protein